MKVDWRLALAGVAAYLVILLVTIPAERVGKWLERDVGGLSLQSVSGTLLSGKARRVSIRGLAIGPVTWSLRPLSLLLARLEYGVILMDPAFRGEGVLGMGLGGHVYLDGLKAELKPDPLVNQFSPLPVETSGLVTLQIESMDLDDGFPVELSGHADWTDAQLIEPVKLALGHVEATLKSEAEALVSHVTGSGETALTGDISVTREGAYTLNLLLTPGASVAPEIIDGLKTFGEAKPGGAFLITDSGHL